MSLLEALNDVVSDMEKVAKDHQGYDIEHILLGFSRQIKVAIKASGASSFSNQVHLFPKQETPKIDLEVRRRAIREEGTPIMVELDDGEGTIVPVDPNMPVGAKVNIGGITYFLTGEGKLERLKKD